MIVCDINRSEIFDNITPLLGEALRWVRQHAGDEFASGVIEIGDGITVKCECLALVPRERARLELHRRYIDIHVPLKGPETIGWASAGCLVHELSAYDEEHDVAFYGDSAQALLHLRRGQLAVFFPDDAHAPNIGIGSHRKLCVKIPVI